MNKKLPLIAVAGLSIFLAGCSLPGVPDETAVEQARMLGELQQQMATLLSGMESLRTQNEELSGMVAKIQYSPDDVKLTPTQLERTQQVITIFSSGLDVEKDFPSHGTGLSELVIPAIDMSGAEMPKAIMPQMGSGQTGMNPPPAKIDTGSVLEVLRKASMQDKSTKPSSPNMETK